MVEIVEFSDKYGYMLSEHSIQVKSETNPNIIYLVRCGPYECSCPDYQRKSTPWMYGENYICKHMRKVLEMELPVDEMLSVLEATDGDIDLFVKNYSWTKLLILYFRQLIVFTKDNSKVIVLK